MLLFGKHPVSETSASSRAEREGGGGHQQTANIDKAERDIPLSRAPIWRKEKYSAVPSCPTWTSKFCVSSPFILAAATFPVDPRRIFQTSASRTKRRSRTSVKKKGETEGFRVWADAKEVLSWKRGTAHKAACTCRDHSSAPPPSSFHPSHAPCPDRARPYIVDTAEPTSVGR